MTQGEGAAFEISRIFFGGAKAHTVEFERVRLQSVVRSLRTTDVTQKHQAPQKEKNKSKTLKEKKIEDRR